MTELIDAAVTLPPSMGDGSARCTAVRVRGSSAGHEPSELLPGRDLVLEVDEAHGEELAHGVGVRDHLSLAQREAVDRAAHRLLARWREACDAALTVDDVCWPFIWEFDLFRSTFVPTVADAVALDRALAAYGARSVTILDNDPRTEEIVTAVAAKRGLSVDHGPGGRDERADAPAERPQPWQRRARRTILRLLTALGLPSRLRSGSVLFMSYWPMMPLLDAMLAEPGRRPAMAMEARPVGVRRSLRVAAQGGWVGYPGPLALHRGRVRAAAALAATRATAPALKVEGLDLGPCLHRLACRVAEPRLGRELAAMGTWRRALGKERIAKVVVPFDVASGARLVIMLARAAGVPTLVLQHGAFFLPGEIHDMTVADEFAVWSEAIAPRVDWDRPPNVVGYPLPHRPPRNGPSRSGSVARIAVLPQPWDASTSLVDTRVIMRHYVAAVGAVRSALPHANIVLRPHPADPLAPTTRLRSMFPELEVDVSSDLVDLMRTSDLCISGTTTATLQAALVQTPVVLLNVTGLEWRWPLGGATSVPIVRTQDELAHQLERWASGAPIGGRAEMLAALGADGGDTTQRLLRLLDGTAAERPELEVLVGA